MQRVELNRRDFHKLTMAALGGMVAGTAAGCAKPAGQDAAGRADSAAVGTQAADEAGSAVVEETAADTAAATADAAGAPAGPVLISGPNVCRGLNHTCANHKGGDNACAGQGACHLAAAHTCHYENECRGQGGCGENPGQNECKAKGNCMVPLGDSAWEKARAAFEKAMTDAGQKFGAAPAES